MKRITISTDDSSQDPPDGMGWKLYSFEHRHRSYEHLGTFFAEDSDYEETDYHKEVRAKLATGLAFICSYFKHGRCTWSLEGSGPQCRWDNVSKAGILIFEEPEGDMGAKSYADRAKDAAAFLEVYTCWCNGDVYGFSVENVGRCDKCGHEDDIEEIASCFGFYGLDADLDDMAEQVRDALGSDTDVEIVGDAAWLADHHDFTGKKAKVA